MASLHYYTISAKEKPQWYELRWKIANLLVRMAKRIHPENPEVKAFFLKVMTDQLIYGGCAVRIEPDKFNNHTEV